MASIVLRPLRQDDLDEIYAWRNDLEVTRHLGRVAMTRDEVQAWFDDLAPANGDRAYAVIAGELFVGYALLSGADPVNRKCEAGIILGSRAHWGRGIGKVVASRLATVAFEEIGMHRILAVASSRNPASIACFQAAGFREEGRLRDANLRDGEFIDLVLLSLLRTEWGGP
jgi:RimJ/RimL family protein N-acetyltransferase